MPTRATRPDAERFPVKLRGGVLAAAGVAAVLLAGCARAVRVDLANESRSTVRAEIRVNRIAGRDGAALAEATLRPGHAATLAVDEPPALEPLVLRVWAGRSGEDLPAEAELTGAGGSFVVREGGAEDWAAFRLERAD
jgi:hypothetical protein